MYSSSRAVAVHRRREGARGEQVLDEREPTPVSDPVDQEWVGDLVRPRVRAPGRPRGRRSRGVVTSPDAPLGAAARRRGIPEIVGVRGTSRRTSRRCGSRSSSERAIGRLVELANPPVRPGRILARGDGGDHRHRVPYYWTPCWYTLDPASLLITSHFHRRPRRVPGRVAGRRVLRGRRQPDHRRRALGHVASRRCTRLTEGDPRWAARRWQDEHQARRRPGADHAPARSATTTWGALGLYREPGSPISPRRETAFPVGRRRPRQARGRAQGTLLFGESSDPELAGLLLGLVVVSADGEVESDDRGRSEVGGPASLRRRSRCPLALRAVAPPGGGSPEAPAGGIPGFSAEQRRLGPPCGSARFAGEERVTVIVEPTQPARIFDLLVGAHGLTQREQEVVRHVPRGLVAPRLLRSTFLEFPPPFSILCPSFCTPCSSTSSPSSTGWACVVAGSWSLRRSSTASI